jgi:dolichyl-phosphate beta-glucosyltransferase
MHEPLASSRRREDGSVTGGAVMLSVVVPAFNEALRLPGTLDSMREHLDSMGEQYEVIVVDDGSDDGTADEAEHRAANWPELNVIRLPVNAGKGAAVREGMLRARGEQRAFSDADLSTPLEELTRLRARLVGDCHVAIASRGLPDSNIEVHQPGPREFAGKTYNRLLRLLVLPGIFDSQCGLKVFTAPAAVACFTPLRTERFGFDAEVLVRARRRGWSIAEVPVRWRHVEASRVSAGRDAARMLLDLLLLRFGRGEGEKAKASRPADRAASPSEP